MKSEIFQIYFNIESEPGAGAKAPEDVCRILERNGVRAKKIVFRRTGSRIRNAFRRLSCRARKYLALFFVSKNKWCVIQSNLYTYPKFFIPKTAAWLIGRRNFAVFIHDLDGLRYQDAGLLKNELAVLRQAKIVVSHNARMSKFLTEHGVLEDRIIELSCFDYLCSDDGAAGKVRGGDGAGEDGRPRIVYAGNLRREKAEFLYELDPKKMKAPLYLYGSGFLESGNSKLKYCGVYAADKVRENLSGEIGLIWDGGTGAEESAPREYTRYNDPHKLSCYLAAGLPVIVWKESAAAEFVKKYGVGYLVDDFYDVFKLDFSDLSEKRRNAEKLGKKIRSGGFTEAALKKIEKVAFG